MPLHLSTVLLPARGTVELYLIIRQAIQRRVADKEYRNGWSSVLTQIKLTTASSTDPMSLPGRNGSMSEKESVLA
jgi:hypothetical protein